MLFTWAFVRATMNVTETVTVAKECEEMPTADKEKKERVLIAAWEIFARFGYQKASVQDIAETAGVSKSVVFKYYQSKEKLYRTAFRVASDEIAAADAEAASTRIAGEDVFSALRKTVDARMLLFARAPYVYQFSYTAAYDADALPRQLVSEEFARRGVANADAERDCGIRRDVSPQRAKQMIFWISQGFLGDQLARGITEPEALKQAYLEWVDLMELLLKERGEAGYAESK